MEKRTIIWEENNEPPKNYIWAKPDGKYYKWSILENAWVLTDVSNAIENKYDKPETGIPAEDLDENVQASLGKADTAVQPSDLKQVDWNQTDDTALDYIKNKPTIPSGGGGTGALVIDVDYEFGTNQSNFTIQLSQEQFNLAKSTFNSGGTVLLKTVDEPLYSQIIMSVMDSILICMDWSLLDYSVHFGAVQAQQN